MRTTSTALLAALLAIALVASACGPLAPSDGEGIELARAADVERLVGTTEDARAAASLLNAFGLELHRRAAGTDPGADLVTSPASIALALAMARAGARGTTADEMDAVLRGFGSDERAVAVAALGALLATRTGRFEDLSGEAREVVLEIVHAAFAQRDLPLEADYLEALAERFASGLRILDYAADPEAARAAINRWVATATADRIRELLRAGDVDGATRLVLVNAIHLRAAWLVPFPEAATADAPFTRLDGTTVAVPTMRAVAALPYATGTGWRAVELPYVGERLGLLVVVPDDLAAFEAVLDERLLAELVDALVPAPVTLGLPRFGTESRLELAELLAAMGMPTAFGAGADFSGITTAIPLQIAKVVHQAKIDVDELGTEAAAATAVVMREGSASGEPVSLLVDRPFLFALRDLESGAVLFLGRIVEPRERAR